MLFFCGRYFCILGLWSFRPERYWKSHRISSNNNARRWRLQHHDWCVYLQNTWSILDSRRYREGFNSWQRSTHSVHADAQRKADPIHVLVALKFQLSWNKFGFRRVSSSERRSRTSWSMCKYRIFLGWWFNIFFWHAYQTRSLRSCWNN